MYVEQIVTIRSVFIDLVIRCHTEAVGPLTLIFRFKFYVRIRVIFKYSLFGIGMHYADYYRIPSSIQKVLVYRIAHGAVLPQPAKDSFKLSEAVQEIGRVDGPLE